MQVLTKLTLGPHPSRNYTTCAVMAVSSLR